MGKENLQEALVAFIRLSVLMAGSFKDGVQVADLPVLMAKLQEPAMAEALKKAYEEIEKVPAEAKDLKADEFVSLLVVMLPELKELMKAVAK